MNKTNIDWPNLDYTWNPFVGCKNNCSYCYARKSHSIRHEAYRMGKLQNCKQFAKPFDEIQFFPNRLLDPAKVKKPSTIFVGSMGDIFYCGIFEILKIIDVCKQSPQHTFMFLTKYPVAYHRVIFPRNVILGATLTGAENWTAKEYIYSSLLATHHRHFLSIEPLLGEFGHIPESIELVIVGAMTGKYAVEPKKEWIDSIKINPRHQKIHYKKSLRSIVVGKANSLYSLDA